MPIPTKDVKITNSLQFQFIKKKNQNQRTTSFDDFVNLNSLFSWKWAKNWRGSLASYLPLPIIKKLNQNWIWFLEPKLSTRTRLSFGYSIADQDCFLNYHFPRGTGGPHLLLPLLLLPVPFVGHTSYTLEPANVRTHYHLWNSECHLTLVWSKP